MKKLSVILFSLIICGYCFAEIPDNNEAENKDFIFGIDTGIFGINISNSTRNVFVFDLNANLANFYVENVTTGIGIGFFPINYSYSINSNEHTLSFFKLYLSWNLNEIFKLGIYSDGLATLGPFFSLQTLNLNNFQNFNMNISYSAGLKFERKYGKIENGRIPFPPNLLYIISSNIELGYNYSNNRHSIYFSISLSPFFWAVYPLMPLAVAIIGTDYDGD
ncbi:MAG: hypothetical protein LBI28_10810 [Treponema sp.]|jgi:hypothetical protein|nr:hypothetical protein [Treponema sp.]